MGFYTGILIESSPPKGGVHELMILLMDLPKEFLSKFFGEEMGGVRGTQTPSFKIFLARLLVFCQDQLVLARLLVFC